MNNLNLDVFQKNRYSSELVNTIVGQSFDSIQANVLNELDKNSDSKTRESITIISRAAFCW